LEAASLEEADLSGAIMRGVFLGQANLRGARLPLSFKERAAQWIHDRRHRFEGVN
jgi:uncharacterized protein YjbI with pentapeptide repeats